MSEENKEKNFPETPDDNNEKTDGDWKWDAAVPETATDDITFEDLAIASEQVSEDAPEEEPEVQEEAEETEEKAEETAEAEQTEEKPAEKKEKKKEKKTEKKEKDPAEKDKGTCIVCGKPIKGGNSELYCEVCARKYTRTHFGIPQLILAGVMVFFVAFSYFVGVSTIQLSSQLAEAEKCVRDMRYMDAITEIETLSENASTLDRGINATLSTFNANHKDVDLFVDGDRSMRIMLNAYVDSLPFNQSQMTNYIKIVKMEVGEKKIEQKGYEKIKDAYYFCKEVISYMTEIEDEWYTFMYTDEKTSEQKIKYDEAIKFIDSCPNETLAQKSLNGYNRAVAAYYAGKDKSVIFEVLDKTIEETGKYGYMFDYMYLQMAWLYEDYVKVEAVADRLYERDLNSTDSYYLAIRANIMQGDFTKADERCERLIKDNPESLDYYVCKAEVLRRMGKFEESVEICKQGIAKGMDAQIYNQQAISYMLMGDKVGSLEAAKNAFEIIMGNTQENASLEILNTIALIACICEDTELYETMEELFAQSGAAFEPVVDECIKGEITFEEIFMEGYGDI